MDINFIKWMCEKAEGFSFIRKQDEDEYYVGYSKFGGDYFCAGNYERFVYPLLLQRACENIMTSHPSESIWFISMDCEDIKAYRFYGDCLDRSEDRVFKIEGSIDQAKESALKYIFDKEREG